MIAENRAIIFPSCDARSHFGFTEREHFCKLLMRVAGFTAEEFQ
jgi:hypothetical protein